MLQEAVVDGIGHIICTPHVTPGIYQFPEEIFQNHFEEAEAFVRQERLPLKLYQGAEVFYTDSTPRMLREGKIRTMNGTEYVLVEFNPREEYGYILEAINQISSAGFTVILAHVERYAAFRKSEQIREIKNRYRALIQMNARTLCRSMLWSRKHFITNLVRGELVDFIATDTHALPGRGTCMRQGMEKLNQLCDETSWERIARRAENTGLIRDNASDDSVPSE